MAAPFVKEMVRKSGENCFLPTLILKDSCQNQKSTYISLPVKFRECRLNDVRKS